VLTTTVLYVKRGEAKAFVIVDAAMNDLVRPTLYEAHHEILPVAEPAPNAPRLHADVVGPVCESGDFLASTASSRRPSGRPAGGDVGRRLWRRAGGNLQFPPARPEVLVKGDQYAVVRPRPTYAELIGLDKLPPWLQRG